MKQMQALDAYAMVCGRSATEIQYTAKITLPEGSKKFGGRLIMVCFLAAS